MTDGVVFSWLAAGAAKAMPGCPDLSCECVPGRAKKPAELPVEVDETSPARPLQVAILGDSVERFSGPVGDLGATPFREAVRNLGESMGAVAGMAVAACGIGQTMAHATEVERLTRVLREVCPPEQFDAAMAEVEDLMDATWMPRVEALEWVIANGRFATANADSVQVAPENPQVDHDRQRGWLGRWFNRTRRQT